MRSGKAEFFKRLECIRDGLDKYIETCYFVQSTSGVSDGFLNSLKISDMEDEEDYLDEDCVEKEGSRILSCPKFSLKDKSLTELDVVLMKKEESFSTMLLRMIDEKNLKDSDVYKQANINRRLFSKIRGDDSYVPSKKTAISFCFALQLNLDEAQKLLATAGYTLSASSRFDLIIRFLLEIGEYNIHFVNIVLDDYGEGTLSR